MYLYIYIYMYIYECIYIYVYVYIYIKARQNGENVNPFGAMASVAGDRSGTWTGWISPDQYR